LFTTSQAVGGPERLGIIKMTAMHCSCDLEVYFEKDERIVQNI
jgi:hypothetical protein